MKITASGRSASILATWILATGLATGLFVCFAGPSQAAPDEDTAKYATSESAAGAPMTLNKYTKHGSRHGKKTAQRKSEKVAEKSDTGKKTDATNVADNGGDNSSAIPLWVANANAQLATATTPTANAAKAMSARANEILQNANAPDKPVEAQPATDTEVVSADQLNDIDRALQATQPPAPTLASASVEPPARPVAPSAFVMAASNTETSTWDQASLIGKIFIGFGALLTMASAARMFMA
jgi:hypothetical protein